MDYSPTHANPITRFRDLLAALAVDRQAWGDAFWLRFAAQVAALCPHPPAEAAQLIRAAAAELRQGSTWYGALASPARFVIAAVLVQAGIRARVFLGQHRQITGLFRAAGIRQGGVLETMAILVLRLSAKGRRHITERQVGRLKAIHDQLKRQHWWLTGVDDLPACAALTHVTGRPGDIAAQVEDCFQRLREAGLQAGDPLQTTACLLPLAGCEPAVAVARYRAVKEAVERRGPAVPSDQYEALAVLALLDHDAEVVAERLRLTDASLRTAQSDLIDSARLRIAADLAALDLIRRDADLHVIADEAGVQRVRAALHTFQIASTVLISQAEIDREVLEQSAVLGVWP